MQTIALDTNAYVAFKRGAKGVVEAIALAPSIVMPVIVLGELRAGFAFGSRPEQNEAELIRFLGSTRVIVQPVDETVTLAYASIYRQLRRKGQPIPTNDLWIAACTLASNAALITGDARFAGIEGLAVLPLA
jgi:tRNA(fMet)-specific endonuclease VapC